LAAPQGGCPLDCPNIDWALIFEQGPADDDLAEAAGIEDWIEGIDSVQARVLIERAEAAKGPPPAAPRPAKPPVARLALGIEDAAGALGVSPDFFHEHVKPGLRITRRGRRQIVAVRELERWLEESAARA